MKTVWTGHPQYTYDYGDYGHYYTPVVSYHDETFYGSKRHLGEKLAKKYSWPDLIKGWFNNSLEYERVVIEEHTWVFKSKPEAIAFMSKCGEEIGRAAELCENVIARSLEAEDRLYTKGRS